MRLKQTGLIDDAYMNLVIVYLKHNSITSTITEILYFVIGQIFHFTYIMYLRMSHD